ncbi:MAG: PQQ-dependent catabolism-associated CXXCW motif protein, partial [Pseudomonadota bacterium]
MNRTLAALLLAVAVATTSQAEAVPEPKGYREDAYRAPVPETLTGGTVVDAEEAHTLWEAGAAFIDVLPQAPKPANLPKGTIWREKVRNSIPGAIWLPNVGYGKIAP